MMDYGDSRDRSVLDFQLLPVTYQGTRSDSFYLNENGYIDDMVGAGLGLSYALTDILARHTSHTAHR